MKPNLFIEESVIKSDFYRIIATACFLFLFICAIAQPNITRIEYYIDTDPGFGKATSVSVTPSINIVDKVIAINPTNLAEGVHRFYVRAMNATGAWGFTNSILFYKPISSGGNAPPPPGMASNITKLEYYIDIDPGFGRATNVSITPGTDLSNVIIPINPGPLAEGVHTFYVRARTGSGAWSFTNALAFFKPIGSGGDVPGPPAPPSNISKLEYYLDIDPGFGKATNIAITPGLDLKDIIIPINPTTISEGVHRFYVRARNVIGSWSMTNSLLFYKPIASTDGPPAPPAAASNITRLEYYIDTDPGYGKAKTVTITPGLEIKDVVIGVDISTLAKGNHMFYVRALNAKGGWSMMNALEFSNGEAPVLSITGVNPTSICMGDTLMITGTSFSESIDPNTQSIKINTIPGQIVSASSTLIKAVFNQSVSGKVAIINTLGTANSNETVTVNPAPTVDPISDQEICAGASSNAITISGSTNNFTWKNNNTATGLAASGTGNIAAFKTTNTTNARVGSNILVTPVSTTGCKGISTSFNIFVDPVIVSAPTISQNGGTLSILTTPGGGGITGYQWLIDGLEISGATNSNYSPTKDGTYIATFTNKCGKGPKSNEIKITLMTEPPPTGIAVGIYVDSSATGLKNGTSWANAYTFLQDALVAAKAGDTILVAQGTYYPDQGKNLSNDDRSLAFNIKDGVVIFGGFPSKGGSLSSRDWVSHRTILSGEIQQDDLKGNNSYHVVITQHVSAATVIDGLIITKGYADGSDIAQSYGGGWYNNGSGSTGSSNPTIKNCSFIFNSAANGAALFNDGDHNGNASPDIINSIFWNNKAGSNGGAIYNFATQGGKSNSSMTNCLIRNNNAHYGGAIYNNGSQGNCNTSLINCLLYLNQAADGAAIYSIGSQGTCFTTVINTIVWSNIKIAFTNLNATVNLSYSLTEATTGYINMGNNIIGRNPFFVAINTDLHLTQVSPAINSGKNTANTLNVDLDGHSRVIGSAIDMGPYEFQASATVDGIPEARSTKSLPELYQNIPNPFNFTTRIGLVMLHEDRGILTISDLFGRTLKVYDRVWNSGYNEVMIDKTELNLSGVYYYSFSTKDFKSVRKMVLVK